MNFRLWLVCWRAGRPNPCNRLLHLCNQQLHLLDGFQFRWHFKIGKPLQTSFAPAYFMVSSAFAVKHQMFYYASAHTFGLCSFNTETYTNRIFCTRQTWKLRSTRLFWMRCYEIRSHFVMKICWAISRTNGVMMNAALCASDPTFTSRTQICLLKALEYCNTSLIGAKFAI